MGKGPGKKPRIALVKRSERAQASGSLYKPPVLTDRCRATHDVPYTLRCVLEASHVRQAERSAIVTSGEHAGARVVAYRMHEDKKGARW